MAHIGRNNEVVLLPSLPTNYLQFCHLQMLGVEGRLHLFEFYPFALIMSNKTCTSILTQQIRWQPKILSVALSERIFTKPSVSAFVLALLFATIGNFPTLYCTPLNKENILLKRAIFFSLSKLKLNSWNTRTHKIMQFCRIIKIWNTTENH